MTRPQSTQFIDLAFSRPRPCACSELESIRKSNKAELHDASLGESFALARDDGQSARNHEEADVILVGASPTCTYLANRGIKAANVPIVPGCPMPGELLSAQKPLIVGLTKDPTQLIQIRRNRLCLLGRGGQASAPGSGASSRRRCRPGPEASAACQVSLACQHATAARSWRLPDRAIARLSKSEADHPWRDCTRLAGTVIGRRQAVAQFKCRVHAVEM